MPTARDHAAGAVVGTSVYIAGGRPGNLTALERYDPTTDRWAELTPLPHGRSALAGVNLGGQFVVIGGENAAETHVTAEVDAYTPDTNRWTKLAPLPTPLQTLAAVVVGGVLYVPGGGLVAGSSRQTNTLYTLR